MSYDLKKRPRDPASQLAQRRSEIMAEYRYYQLDPIRIGLEPISMELALQLGLIIDKAAPPVDQPQEAAE